MSETRISARRLSARSAPTKSSTNSSAGAIKQLGGSRELSQVPTLLEHGDAVAHLDRLVDVVGDEENRLADLRLQAQELVLEALAGDRVDGAEGFVHQHHPRVGGKGAGDADTLLLATRELGWIALAELGVEPDQGQQLLGALGGVVALPANQPRHGGDVLSDGAMGKEADLLNHIADLAAKLRRRAVANRAAADEHVAV